jgi:hypothetical protein
VRYAIIFGLKPEGRNLNVNIKSNLVSEVGRCRLDLLDVCFDHGN